ncbi:hypothetical protein C8Q80DRAFT_1204973 [Daedaleopsis nitida]|nr:hypothetical protein C8Q80DRAFT_1204973 [Daedaleopsis nitida]
MNPGHQSPMSITGGGPARTMRASAVRVTPYPASARPLRVQGATPPPPGGSPIFSSQDHTSSLFTSFDDAGTMGHLGRQSPGFADSPTADPTTSLDTLAHLNGLSGGGPGPQANAVDPMDNYYPPFRTPGPAPHSSATPAHSNATPGHVLSARELEQLIQKRDLGVFRNKIYDFNQMSAESKMTLIFTQQLSTDAKLSSLIDMVSAFTNSVNACLEGLEKICESSWTPLKPQVKIIRALARHYLCKPIATYAGLTNYIKLYIQNNADILGLSLYKTNPVVRTILNSHLTSIINEVKSNFHKTLFTALKGKVPLKVSAKNLFQSHHLVPVPEEVPDVMLGTFAYMRQIGAPILQEKSKKGKEAHINPRFWKFLDQGLADGYNSCGKGDRATNHRWAE